MKNVCVLLGVFLLTACGYSSKEELKAEAFHSQIIVSKNYQELFQCYLERSGYQMPAQVLSDLGLAVENLSMDPSSWGGRSEFKRIDASTTQVDLWRTYEFVLSKDLNYVHACAQS